MVSLITELKAEELTFRLTMFIPWAKIVFFRCVCKHPFRPIPGETLVVSPLSAKKLIGLQPSSEQRNNYLFFLKKIL